MTPKPPIYSMLNPFVIRRGKNKMFRIKSDLCFPLNPTCPRFPIRYPESAFSVEDRRTCVLCFTRGDAVTDGEGRLLNMDTDKWVHLNCALWSAEVYETLNGALMNVDVAVNRGKNQDCSLCNKKGSFISSKFTTIPFAPFTENRPPKRCGEKCINNPSF